MVTYLFILGRNPEISRAELIAVFGEKIRGNERDGRGERDAVALALVDQDTPFEHPQRIINRLGGTIKIAEIVDTQEFGAFDVDAVLERYWNAAMPHLAKEKKVLFGASTFNLAKRSDKVLTEILKKSKKILTAHDFKARFLNKKIGNGGMENVSDVAASEENIDENGGEIIVVTASLSPADKKTIYIARTVARQDFRSYALRDYEKPFRDNKMGMLPPKLAQVMLNLGLAQLPPQKKPPTQKNQPPQKTPLTIYDPFCGSGTIPMEALLMGHNVVGSDLDPARVANTEQNIAWIKQHFPHTEHLTAHLFTHDAQTTMPLAISETPDLVVTESYLGPVIDKYSFNLDKVTRFQHELAQLYERSLRALAVLHVPIVIAIAAYRFNGKTISISDFPVIAARTGFEIVKPLPDADISLIYDRPDQTVAREIFVLKPTR